MPLVSFWTTKQEPNSRSLTSMKYHTLPFVGHKYIEYFKCNNKMQAQGAHIQLNKSQLISKSKQAPLNGNIVPQGYIPYSFNSLAF